MLYKNKRTGGLIETGCSISGGDWEPVPAPAPKKGNGKPKGKGKVEAEDVPSAGAEEKNQPTGEDTPAEP